MNPIVSRFVNSIINNIVGVIVASVLGGLTIISTLITNQGLAQHQVIILGLGLINIILWIFAFRNYRLRSPQYFNNFDDAKKTIQKSLENYMQTKVQQRSEIVIRVIGVSLRYSWDVIDTSIRDHIEKNKANLSTIRLLIVMTDENWLQQHAFGKEWSDIASITLAKIRKLAIDYIGLYKGGRLIIELHKHDHLPTRHGILIGNRLLFLSFCEMQADPQSPENRLTVGQNPYELYQVRGQLHAQEKIDQFKNLHTYYVSDNKKNGKPPITLLA